MCHGRLPICATVVPYHLTPCQPTSNNMFINSKPERVGRVYMLTQEYRHKKNEMGVLWHSLSLNNARYVTVAFAVA